MIETWIHNGKMIIDKYIFDKKIAIHYSPDIVLGDIRVERKVVNTFKDFPKEIFGELILNSCELTNFNNVPYVHSDIILKNNSITSLKGIQEKINGTLDLSYNKLSNLKYCPKEIDGAFDISNNELTSLEGAPNKVISLFCENNKLTNLIGCPKEIKEQFWCYENSITSLKGMPEKININFDCENNPLTNLNFGPKKVNGTVICDNEFLIEGKLIEEGYTDFYPDLLNLCIRENYSIKRIKHWPGGFITDKLIESAKGINKFDL